MAAGSSKFDAVVIGSGAGGSSAAARLAHAGYHTLLLEGRDRIGGRASTVPTDGYMINTGAVAIEFGGVLEETCQLVGAEWDIRPLDPPVVYRIGRRDIKLGKGGWATLINKATKKGAGLLAGLGEARRGELPSDDISTKEWLNQYTKNKTIHALFRNLCGAIFSVNSDELPARAFLTYFMRKSAFKDFGFCPRGTIGITQGLADSVERNGGEVWLNSEVVDLKVEDGRVAGAVIKRGGETIEVEAEVFVSNAGPRETAELVGWQNLPKEYADEVDEKATPAAIFAINIASDEPLTKAPGIVAYGITDRLCNLCNLTATCPELAPEGKHLAVAYAVPVPAIGEFAEDEEIRLSIEDLRRQYKNFDQRAEVLSVQVRKGEFPGQRTIHGRELPRETPLENLWNVGDGVREYANGGTEACAETAKIVVGQIRELHGAQLVNA